MHPKYIIASAIVSIIAVVLTVLLLLPPPTKGEEGASSGLLRGYVKPVGNDITFPGVVCRGAESIADMKARYGNNDYNDKKSAMLACALTKDCAGIYEPASNADMQFVFDTSECEDDPDYHEGANEAEFGRLIFPKGMKCKPGYVNPSNACRTKVLSPCENDVCTEQETCAMLSDDTPYCFPLDFYDHIRKSVADEDDPIFTRAELSELTVADDLVTQYRQEQIDGGVSTEEATEKAKRWKKRTTSANMLAELVKRYPDEANTDRINEAFQTKFTNDGENDGGERIFCYNGGRSINIDGHQYCVCNLNAKYDNNAAWGGTRCDVKCPVWIDVQRNRISQLENGLGDGESLIHRVDHVKGTFGYMLDPKEPEATEATDGLLSPEYDNFFKNQGQERDTSDPSIQICGNEVAPNGKLIRRGTCVATNPFSRNPLGAHCACVGRHLNQAKGCRVDSCPFNGQCGPFNEQSVGSCQWVPDHNGTKEVKNTNTLEVVPNEPVDGMRRCVCASKKVPIDWHGVGGTSLKKLYNYQTEYELLNRGGTEYTERTCLDPCALFACGHGNDVSSGAPRQFDKDAECGIMYDTDERTWGRATGTGSKLFCKCSAGWKGVKCTEKNDCPEFIANTSGIGGGGGTATEGSPCGSDIASGARGVCRKGYTTKDNELVIFAQAQHDDPSQLPRTAHNSAQCKCFSGRGGHNCGLDHLSMCFGNGVFLDGGDTCNCCDGAKGSRCQFTDKYNCNGAGSVSVKSSEPSDDQDETFDETFECSCKDGFHGAACEYSEEETCNGHGIPGSFGVCTCQDGYQGKGCHAPPDCPFQPCHGETIAPGEICQIEPESAQWAAGDSSMIYGPPGAYAPKSHWAHFVQEKGSPEKGTSNVCLGGYGDFDTSDKSLGQNDHGCRDKRRQSNGKANMACGVRRITITTSKDDLKLKKKSDWTHILYHDTHSDDKCQHCQQDEFVEGICWKKQTECDHDFIVEPTTAHAYSRDNSHDPNKLVGAYEGDGCSCKTATFALQKAISTDQYATQPGDGNKVIYTGPTQANVAAGGAEVPVQGCGPVPRSDTGAACENDPHSAALEMQANTGLEGLKLSSALA